MQKSLLIEKSTRGVIPTGDLRRRFGVNLTGEIRTVASLSLCEREQMFALLKLFFHDVTRPKFFADLAEKEWCILLKDRQGAEIQGFSTLMRFSHHIDNAPVMILFSGDTIVHRDYWGETLLPQLWGRLVFRLAAQSPQQRTFWFLICSGYKTYRFLPVFFREFHPAFNHPMPETAKRLLDEIALWKFPDEYDATSGIVRLNASTPLKEGVAEVTAARCKNPHVDFFVRANPGYEAGEELACLTEITPHNLTRAGRRMLSQVEDFEP